MSWQPGRDPTLELRDDAAVDQAVTARGDARMLHRIAVETATLVGTLRDLAERRAGVTLALHGDQVVQGTMLAVAPDHAVVATAARQHAHVRLDDVVTVRPDPDHRVPVAQGNRTVSGDRTLAHCLSRWEPDRPWVVLAVRGRSEPLRGRLAAVGEDVVTLDESAGSQPSYVPTAAVQVVLVDAR